MTAMNRADGLFLITLICIWALGFAAGYAWKGRECAHLITVQEVTEIQDGILEDIGELRDEDRRLREEFGESGRQAGKTGRERCMTGHRNASTSATGWDTGSSTPGRW